MNTVATTPNPVNSTPETAVSWIESKVRSHELSSNGGRLWTVAINAMLGLRRDDEPKDTLAMIELLPELERRWCIANDDSKGDTGRTYASRARSGLKAHLRFLENPGGFRFETKPKPVASGTSKKKETEKPTHAPAATAAASSPPPGDGTPPGSSSSIRIPLGGGRYIKTEFPDDVSAADVMRHFWVFVGYAHDFDPASRNEFFGGLVKAG